MLGFRRQLDIGNKILSIFRVTPVTGVIENSTPPISCGRAQFDSKQCMRDEGMVNMRRVSQLGVPIQMTPLVETGGNYHSGRRQNDTLGK
jgi:hypothetical protein